MAANGYGGYRNDRNWMATGCLVLTCIFIPIVGHIILTFMILGDDMTSFEKVIWLVAVWLLPFVGPFLYLLVGQRRNRLLSPRAM